MTWGMLVLQWQVSPTRQIINLRDDLEILVLWRNDAYNYWFMKLSAAAPIANYSSATKDTVIVKVGYPVRTADIDGQTLRLTGDINATTDVELIYEPTAGVTKMTFNGKSQFLPKSQDEYLSATAKFTAPEVSLPDFSSLEWKYIDSLPWIQSSYDDSKWICRNQKTSTNP